MEIYCLQTEDGKLLDPSIQATVLAKYSRSALSARDVMRSLSQDEANKFHTKWTINYGHSSVAELACVPICFEGVSMIASKFIEKFQRAGYSEKSTRYQRFSSSSFVNPTVNKAVSYFAESFYKAYESLYSPTLALILKITGENDPNLPKVKARVFDNLRYLLPAGTGTNLAAVINLRDLRYMISEALESPNPEIKDIGEKLQKVGLEIAPGLLGNIKPIFNAFRSFFHGSHEFNNTSGVKLISPTRSLDQDFRSTIERLYGMSYGNFCHLMNIRGNNHVPEVFRLFHAQLDVLMDYGAYRDLQRHRRCEQFPEKLTVGYGYEIPDDIKGTELESKYIDAMEKAIHFELDGVSNDPELCQYVIPMGYRHRTLFQMDIAELYYLVELRTKPQGHISYRRIAYEMYESVSKVSPEIMKWCKAIKPTSIGDHL